MLQPLRGRLAAHGQGSRSRGDTAPANTLIATGALKNTPLARNTAAAASKIREVQRAWHAGDACAGDPTRQPRRAASTAGGKSSSRVRGWRPTANRTAAGQSCQHVSSKPPATSWHPRPLLQWWPPPLRRPPATSWHPVPFSVVAPGVWQLLAASDKQGRSSTPRDGGARSKLSLHLRHTAGAGREGEGQSGAGHAVLAMLCRIAPRLMQQPTDSRPTHACTRMCCGGFAKHRALPRVSLVNVRWVRPDPPMTNLLHERLDSGQPPHHLAHD